MHSGEVLTDYTFFRFGSFVERGLDEELSEAHWEVPRPLTPDYFTKHGLPVPDPFPDPNDSARYVTYKGYPKLVWKKEKIAGRHIWADKYLKQKVCISDELAAEFKKQKMKYFDLTEGGVV